MQNVVEMIYSIRIGIVCGGDRHFLVRDIFDVGYLLRRWFEYAFDLYGRLGRHVVLRCNLDWKLAKKW